MSTLITYHFRLRKPEPMASPWFGIAVVRSRSSELADSLQDIRPEANEPRK
jgi:hypothetical protein